MHPVDQQLSNENEYSFAIPLRLETAESHLSVNVQRNKSEDDQTIGRPVIAEAIGSSFSMQATLVRPIIQGVYDERPAFLLKFHFSFLGHTAKWRTRIQSADITIEFADAPYSAASSDGQGAPRSIGDHAPKICRSAFQKAYRGPIISHSRTTTTGVGLSVPVVPGAVSLEAYTEKSATRNVEEQLIAQSMIFQDQTAVKWRFRQKNAAGEGIPNTMTLPLIVAPADGVRRFSAKLTIHASYGLWRGPIAEIVPVLGKKDDPIFFDPEKMAMRNITPDGQVRDPHTSDVTFINPGSNGLSDVDLDAIAVESFS